MAHEVETMFSAREVPWHKLGKIVDTELTAKEAIIAGGMDWRCEEHPLYLRGQAEVDGIPVIGQSAPEHKAIVRASDSSILGIVKNSYHIIQNSECFDFMDDVIGSGQAVYHTAGSLRNGNNRPFFTRFIPPFYHYTDIMNTYFFLRNYYHMSSTRHTSVKCNPSSVTSHDFNNHDPMMTFRGCS